MAGSIEKRGKNSYRLIVCHGYDLQGKSVRHTKTVHGTKAQARIELAKFVAEVQQGTVVEGKVMTFGEFTEIWKRDYGSKELAPGTYRRYLSMLESRILPYLSHFRLDKLKPTDIMKFYDMLEKDTQIRRIKHNNVLELMRASFGANNKDFITAVDENNVIVVKDLTEMENTHEIDALCSEYKAYLEKEGIRNVHIAYGTIVKEIKEVSRSYKEAKMALDVGKIFFDERNIIAYSELGIGRLIYQLPIPLCKMFIKEIFGGKSPDDFDEETLTTIMKFFENSLNVSETSRQLFIHRNTLVYRLDKLQKTTGLDLRVFEDAITFKIALMVVKYMKYMESLQY